jgi:hypothetical protein
MLRGKIVLMILFIRSHFVIYMLCVVQIRNNRYEYRLIFLLLANKNIVLCLCVKKTFFVYFNHVFRTGVINLRIVIKNMVVVFIRKHCIRMVFVYFAFWGLQEEFSTLPCSLIKYSLGMGGN